MALCLICLLLVGCGIATADVSGQWESEDGTRISLNADGTYAMTYAEPLTRNGYAVLEEVGTFNVRGKKIDFSMRDRYYLHDNGDVKFMRLIETEDRTEKLALEGASMTIGTIVYKKNEDF